MSKITKLTEDNVKFGVKEILKNYNCQGRDSAAHKIAQFVMELASEKQKGDDVNKDLRAEARARGMSDVALEYHDKLCKALGFSIMNLTPKDWDVYEWVAAQENGGKKISTFAAWAKNPSRVDFIRMYRKDSENIRIDWERAFKAINSGPDTITLS